MLNVYKMFCVFAEISSPLFPHSSPHSPDTHIGYMFTTFSSHNAVHADSFFLCRLRKCLQQSKDFIWDFEVYSRWNWFSIISVQRESTLSPCPPAWSHRLWHLRLSHSQTIRYWITLSQTFSAPCATVPYICISADCGRETQGQLHCDVQQHCHGYQGKHEAHIHEKQLLTWAIKQTKLRRKTHKRNKAKHLYYSKDKFTCTNRA